MHFVNPGFYLAMMPRVIPENLHAPLVVFTGVCELAGGVAVLVPTLRRLSGLALIVFLVAVFPANVQMLMNAQAAGASAGAVVGLWVRLPVQGLLIWWVWRATLSQR
jgi:uncharacterized membrane protein